MNQQMMWINQQQRRVESEASGNQARVRHCRSMSDVVRLSHVSIPPEIRFLKRSIPGLRSLQTAVEARLTELVRARLKVIESKATAAEAKDERGLFIRECDVLRGDFAQQWRLADTESARLVYLKVKAEKPSDPASVPPQ